VRKQFDPPGAASSEALSINSKGAVTGTWTDQFSEEHGYIRSASGKCCTTVDVPKGLDTNSDAINDFGLVTGFFFKKGLAHGFIRKSGKP
jgi:hypothetical protein